jgi:hypothetical protein
MNKVLIACPLGGKKQYSLNKWLNFVSLQDHPDFEICFCVNGKGKTELARKLGKIRLKHISDKKERKIKILNLKKDKELTIIQRLVFSRELIRRYAVEKNFNYLLYLDSDTIPLRKNFLKDLISKQKPVITGLYYYKHSGGTPVMINPHTQQYFTKKELLPLAKQNKLTQIKYCGFGCILISRPVFSKIAYDYEKFGERRSDDYAYCELLEQNKIPVYLYVRQLCNHIEDKRYSKLEQTLQSKIIIQEND